VHLLTEKYTNIRVKENAYTEKALKTALQAIKQLLINAQRESMVQKRRF